LILNALGKLEGYRRRLVYEWNQWQARRTERGAEQAFDRWLRQLSHCPPDVLMGANFASFGGVRTHLHSIQRNSQCRIELAPPEELVSSVGLHRFQGRFREPFFEFDASKLKAVHSHVFPWFIDWCRHQQIHHGVRWIHTYHLKYYPEHADGPLLPWQQEINESLINVARHADVCLSVSKWQCEELRDKHGIPATYLPNGVDVRACDRANPDRFRKKICVDRFILYVGRNDPVKNPVEFVELARRIPLEQFVMIGGGLDAPAATESFGALPGNLRILGGVGQSEVQDAIAGCDALVVTSKREGLPTLVLEAMAHDKPMVVPDEPGCLEAIDYGRYGEVYQLGDVGDLVKKVIKVTERGHDSRNSRNRVLEEYDWRVVLPKLDRIYQAPDSCFV
jgi:glycosyltransferase involved in cell wall biosynthesis